MTVFTDQQIAALARGAGLTSSTSVAWAVAICLAESGGNPSRVSRPNTDGSIDRGLWQINNHAHPDVTDAQALSPTGNATAMARISLLGHSWGPWSTYWTDPVRRIGPGAGAARAFLPRGMTAAGAPPVPPPTTTGTPTGIADDLGGALTSTLPGVGLVTGILGAGGGSFTDQLGALGSIARGIAAAVGYIGKAAAWIANPHSWVRVVYVIGGFAAVLAGLAILERSTAAGQAVGNAAGHAAHAAARIGEVAAA